MTIASLSAQFKQLSGQLDFLDGLRQGSDQGTFAKERDEVEKTIDGFCHTWAAFRQSGGGSNGPQHLS